MLLKFWYQQRSNRPCSLYLWPSSCSRFLRLEQWHTFTFADGLPSNDFALLWNARPQCAKYCALTLAEII